jgi:hypothetical protein
VTSIDLIRKRSATEIVRSTLSLYGDYPWLFLILAFVVMAPWDLVKLAVTGIGPLGDARHVGFLERESLGLLDLLLISPLISAMHVHAVVAIGDAQRPRLSAVASKGLRVLPVVGVAALIAGVGVEIGFFALVIPGIVLWIRLSVVPQAAAIERNGVRDALRSSWRLTRDHGSHIFGLLTVFAILGVGVALSVRALDPGASTSAGNVALGIAVNTIIASFTALASALLYFDLLARRKQAQAVHTALSPSSPLLASPKSRMHMVEVWRCRDA